jgi:hypothetical protein
VKYFNEPWGLNTAYLTVGYKYRLLSGSGRMLRVVTAVQQIMTEFNGALSEEDKIVAITKIVLNLMKQDGH